MRAGHTSNKRCAWMLSLAVLAGCNPLGQERQVNGGDNSWESGTDLSSEYGGYAFTDEKPSFGDAAFHQLEIDENAMAVADSDTVIAPNTFLVRVLWGQLRGNREAQAFVDWSGAFAVSSGRLAAVRTLAFEPRTDYLLKRDDRQVVPFASMTRPHYDGLLLMIHDTDNDPSATLSMRTGPYSGSWTFAELREVNLVIPVDDMGNAVSVTGLSAPDDPACLGGSVRGHWVQREGERGVFRGVWMTRLGRPVGHLRGHFGVNDQGENVWFAKIIARDGRVLGLARGGFVPNDDGPGGRFVGHWAASEGERSGSIAGHYLPSRRAVDAVGGFFQARWQTNCDGTPDPTTDPTADPAL